jgi:hypothetical protein
MPLGLDIRSSGVCFGMPKPFSFGFKDKREFEVANKNIIAEGPYRKMGQLLTEEQR